MGWRGLARLLCLAGIVALSPIASAAIPAAERGALIDLYNATCGSAWGNRVNWRNVADTDFNAAGTECTWGGVVCDATSSTVTGLDMAGQGACGALPASIGNLSNLEKIDYRMVAPVRNFLAGPLPSEIGNLSKLKWLDLSANLLDGTIPAAWSSLVNLEHLDLGDQLAPGDLTGGVPAWLGSLTKLTYLSLSGNALTGPIPPELGNLASLVDLWLSGNQLTGTIPPELGNLTSLKWLGAQDNQLSGPIPAQLGNLASLFGLYLFANQLTGEFPPSLCSLANLRELNLAANRLTGPLPAALGDLAAMRLFVVRQNALSGELPGSIVTWTNLYGAGIDLHYNALHSANPAVGAFVDAWHFGGDWRATQTVAPQSVTAQREAQGAVRLDWAPIAYTGDTGGYRVRYGTQSGGPYTAFPTTTADKLASTLLVTGLNPATTYHFVVETWTDPHPVGGMPPQQNTVVSDPSVEVSASTPRPPTPVPTLAPLWLAMLSLALMLTAASWGRSRNSRGGDAAARK